MLSTAISNYNKLKDKIVVIVHYSADIFMLLLKIIISKDYIDLIFTK